jgi:glycogen phosphorylase
MVSGCDIWLNNPRRPLEASGTSGMKASCHGCMNFSIMDGWWREGYDGTNGFAIGPDSHPDSVEEQDRVDSANLYQTLTEQVVPMFYNRDVKGIPREWLKRMRRHGHARAAVHHRPHGQGIQLMALTLARIPSLRFKALH